LLAANVLFRPELKIGFGMAWGMDIALPCTVLVAVSVIVQLVRALKYLLKLS
jgi:hypothetical protein